MEKEDNLGALEDLNRTFEIDRNCAWALNKRSKTQPNKKQTVSVMVYFWGSILVRV